MGSSLVSSVGFVRFQLILTGFDRLKLPPVEEADGGKHTFFPDHEKHFLKKFKFIHVVNIYQQLNFVKIVH